MRRKKIDRTPSEIGKLSRQKGHDFERLVAQRFRKIFKDAKRHLEYQIDEAKNGVDLTNTGNYLIQCKRGRKYSPISAIFEIQIDPIEGGCPILVTKGDEQEIMAVLPLRDLLGLIKYHERGKTQNA